MNVPGLMEDGGNELNKTWSLLFRSLHVLIKYSTRQKVVRVPKGAFIRYDETVEEKGQRKEEVVFEVSLNGREEVGREFEADRTSREALKEAKGVGLGNNKQTWEGQL